MRRFLLKLIVAVTCVLALHLAAGTFADGRTDAYYLRFTSGPYPSLVLGTSRAAQGLRPDVLAPFLAEAGLQGPLYNYAFTVDHSPYGATYLRAIEQKLDTSARNGLFLLAVDPWSLSQERTLAEPREDSRFLHDQTTFNARPNYEYLVRNLRSGWGGLIAGPRHTHDTSFTLMPDGWLRMRIALDSTTVRDRTERKLATYVSDTAVMRPSLERLDALRATAELCRRHGRVVLLRLPVAEGLASLEDSYWPRFSVHMQGLAQELAVPYLDLMPERHRSSYTDGNHLDTASARSVSLAVGDLLRTLPSPR